MRPRASQRRRDPQRYRVIGEHGRGGLGRVSRAHDQDLGRDVAIKELLSRDPRSEARFHREALITARLEHPGIVPVYEAGRWPDGTPFYAMKLVAGRPLRQLIAERITVDERIALLHHVIAVADAMAYAHDQQIIHRDLKPANVIVGDFGETVIIDWGLAKDLAAPAESVTAGTPSQSPGDDHLTTTGCAVGTPAYMAPEQARGEAVDQRADVFAIGAMLWELCSLQRVPPNEARLRDRMLSRAGIDRDLATIIGKALARDPERRYRHAGALAADLKAFKSGARITARSYSLFAMLAHWIRRHRMLALSVMVVALLVIASAVALAALYRDGLRSRMAQEAAELSVTQLKVEQGRQALLHDEGADALTNLSEAYSRGERSSSVAFMLARAMQPRLAEQARFQATSGHMWSATFSPDGTRIVTTDDKAAQIWDVANYTPLYTLPHGTTVRHAVFSADGARLFTAGGDGVVRIWEAATGLLQRELRGASPKPLQYALATLSPDGSLVAAIDIQGEITNVWEVRTGAVVANLRNDPTEFWALVFSADGRWLATSGGKVCVFDTSTWTQVVALPALRVRSLNWDPTAPRLATGSAGGDASIWAVPSGARLQRLRERGAPVEAVAFSPSGQLVITAARDGLEQVWSGTTGELISEFSSHSKILAAEFDATSKLVLAASADGAVVVSDAAQGTQVAVLDGPKNVVMTAHFDPSSRLVVGASWDGTARVWDASAPYRRWSSPPVTDDCGIVASLEPDRRFVAVGCYDHSTRIWDTAHDQLLAELPGVSPLDGEVYAFPAVSADGDRAAIARDTSVEVYTVPGGQLIRTVEHGATITAVAFALTGHDLVSGAADGSLLVTRDDREPLALPASPGAIDTTTILVDGRVIAVDATRRLRIYDQDRAALILELEVPTRALLLRPSGDNKMLITVPDYADPSAPALWDLAHYQLIGRLEGHVGAMRSVRWVSGDQILTTGGDGTARRWDGTNGRLLQTYRGSSRFLADAVIDPEGKVVVAGGGDGVLRFWDVVSGQLLWKLPAHKSHVVALHFEGNDIVTRGFGGDVARWALPKPEQVIAACQECNAASP